MGSGRCCGATVVLLLLVASLVCRAQMAAAAPAALIVDEASPTASDANPGTAAAPLRSINAALARLGTAAHARIVVRPGIYRESLSLPRGAVGLSLVSEVPHEAIISGAEPLLGWHDQGAGLFWAKWGKDLSPAAVPAEWPASLSVPESARRRELLLVDGRLYRQVYAAADLSPRSFFIDPSTKRVVIRPPSGVDPSHSRIERGIRARLLLAEDTTDLSIEGFVFLGAANPFTAAAVEIGNSSDLLLRGDDFIDNNGTGLALHDLRGVRIESNVVARNGSAGLGAWRIEGLSARGNVTSDNNWRGRAAGFTGWSVAGAKFLQIHGATIEDHRAMGNGADGLWFDTDVRDVVLRGATLCDNAGSGLEIEASQGPFEVSKSVICRNARGITGAGVAGLSVSNSTIVCNNDAQIEATGTENRHVLDFRSGETRLVNNREWRFVGNVIAARPGSALFGATLGPAGWMAFVRSFTGSGNDWAVAPGASRLRLHAAFVDSGGLFGEDRVRRLRDVDAPCRDPD
jgi:hypothetical protein